MHFLVQDASLQGETFHHLPSQLRSIFHGSQIYFSWPPQAIILCPEAGCLITLFILACRVTNPISGHEIGTYLIHRTELQELRIGPQVLNKGVFIFLGKRKENKTKHILSFPKNSFPLMLARYRDLYVTVCILTYLNKPKIELKKKNLSQPTFWCQKKWVAKTSWRPLYGLHFGHWFYRASCQIFQGWVTISKLHRSFYRCILMHYQNNFFEKRVLYSAVPESLKRMVPFNPDNSAHLHLTLFLTSLKSAQYLCLTKGNCSALVH